MTRKATHEEAICHTCLRSYSRIPVARYASIYCLACRASHGEPKFATGTTFDSGEMTLALVGAIGFTRDA